LVQLEVAADATLDGVFASALRSRIRQPEATLRSSVVSSTATDGAVGDAGPAFTVPFTVPFTLILLALRARRGGRLGTEEAH
jgi:hypothetical protein